MLVLPTGGGKTRVAVTTALDKAINDGYKILWIAHRHMLLEQAKQTFHEFSALSKQDLSIKIISGKYNHIQSLSTNDNVVIISNMSMGIQETNEEGKDYNGLAKKLLKEVLFTKNQKWLIIVDEAHHSIAKSYKQWIGANGWLRRYRKDNIKILGLTATPNFISKNDVTSYNENRTKELSNIYDNNLIGSISTQKLIDDGILSRPNFVTIDTEVEFDAEVLLSRVKNIKGSLTNKVLEKELNEQIAEHEGRNQLIVSTYLNGAKNMNFTKSPTLIFAANILNAITLKEAFKRVNISADVIYSNKSNNDEVIADFRSGKLKVLINIEILTEGSDIPEIQNIFISKITGSKILYRQMVGRGLRGIGSGGTRTANIVTFRDNIINYHKDFFNAQKLQDGLFKETIGSKSSPVATITSIPESEIAKAYEKFLGLLNGNQNIEITSAIPIGYYDLDETNQQVNVYEHQLDSYKNFLIAYKNNVEVLDKTTTKIKEQYFKSENMLFDVALDDLGNLISYIKELEIVPNFIEFGFKDKLESEVKSIALKYTDNVDFKSLEDDYIDSIYAKDFYSYVDFETECLSIIKNFRHHNSQPIKVVEIEENEDLGVVFDEEAHDKESIFASAKAKILKLLNISDLKNSPDKFEWTPKAYRSYWGMAYAPTDDYSEKSNKIEINKILQLKGIDSKIIEFVVYHELLHTELNNYTHDKEFKEYEAMFPDFVYCEQMLYKIGSVNFDNITSMVYQSNYRVYEKDEIKNLKKLVKREELMLLTNAELQDICANEAFRDSLTLDKKFWFLTDDLTNSINITDGKIHKVPNAYLIVKDRKLDVR